MSPAEEKSQDKPESKSNEESGLVKVADGNYLIDVKNSFGLNDKMWIHMEEHARDST